MKKLIILTIFGVALFAFAGCNEPTEKKETSSKCQAGKCGEGKCGGK